MQIASTTPNPFGDAPTTCNTHVKRRLFKPDELSEVQLGEAAEKEIPPVTSGVKVTSWLKNHFPPSVSSVPDESICSSDNYGFVVH